MTIYSIAKEADVSPSTVSRVINKKSGVKPQTREKVVALLEKYNYLPDFAARGLVSGNTRIIGILVTDIRVMHHTEGAYIIEREFAQNGYNCIILNTGTDATSQCNSIEIMASRKPDAVVMIGSTFQSEKVAHYIERYLADIPVAIANGFLELPNVYGVLANEREGVEDCVHLLAQKGRKHIAFINDAVTVSSLLKEEGYLEGVARHCAGMESMVVRFDKTGSIDESKGVTRDLLRRHPEVDAIIYATDLIASGGLAGIRMECLRVPEDIAVIGIDNSIYAEICYPQLTSLDNKMLELNASCASMILNVLSGKPVAHKTLVYTEVVQRDST